MRKLVPLVALSAGALIAVGCGRRSTIASDAAKAKDLQLANTARSHVQLSPDELARQSKPLAVARERVTQHPKVQATVAEAAVPVGHDGGGDLSGPLPDAQIAGPALPAPTIGFKPAPAPLPVYPGNQSYDPADRSGAFDPARGIVPRGTVIRGGGVGDDHCDPKRDPRGGGVWGGGIFRPGGGMGTGRAIP